MKHHIPSVSLLTSFVVLFVVISQGVAISLGGDVTVTPTIFTPSATDPSATSTPSAIVTTDTLMTSFTQADLSLLTGNIQRPNGLVWNDGKIFAACSGDWTVYEIDALTGNTNQYIYGPKNAHAMLAKTFQGKTSLWIPDFQSNNVVEITQGVVKNIATNLNGPWGIAEFSDTQLLVTNLRGNNVVMVGGDEPKEVITKLRSPTGIVVDDTYVYIANTGSARRAIEWFTTASVSKQSAPVDAEDKTISHSLVTGLQNVTNITMGSDGFLYFGYALGTRGVVGRVNPATCRDNGGCGSNQVEIVVYSELAAPLAGMTLSPDMVLYIHSIFSPEIYWVDLTKTAGKQG